LFTLCVKPDNDNIFFAKFDNKGNKKATVDVRKERIEALCGISRKEFGVGYRVITSIAFSRTMPNLVAIGFSGGQVRLIDIGKDGRKMEYFDRFSPFEFLLNSFAQNAIMLAFSYPGPKE
jgi:hypothetical protein